MPDSLDLALQQIRDTLCVSGDTHPLSLDITFQLEVERGNKVEDNDWTITSLGVVEVSLPLNRFLCGKMSRPDWMTESQWQAFAIVQYETTEDPEFRESLDHALNSLLSEPHTEEEVSKFLATFNQ